MTKEMYEDLLERNRLQISELNTLTEEQDYHIIELEEENEKLKKKNENLLALINAERKRQEECNDVHLQAIAELDKENVELKEDNKVMADNYSKMEQKFYNNLSKAKELLARWVSDKPYTVSEQKDLISDTEQFLKEV